MVSVNTSILTNGILKSNDPAEVEFASGLIAIDTSFAWITGSGNSVRIFGSGFTYAGSGDGRELASGAIDRIVIDVGADNGSETAADFVITDTESLAAGAIRKGDAQRFWGEILKGSDGFNLAGTSESEIGSTSGAFFGDDFSCPNTAGNFADAGASDTIFGADNDLLLIGDVYEVRGSASGNIIVFAEYSGGDDTIVGVVSRHFVRLVGDAGEVGADGTLIGGDDMIVNPRNSGSSNAIGDVYGLGGNGVVIGGDDDITQGRGGTVAGDVWGIQGDNIYCAGGDDVISGAHLHAAGDVAEIDASLLGTSGVVICGDDTITGGAGLDVISGDVLWQAGPGCSITAGNDQLIGGKGDDELYGECNTSDISNFSGGHDVLRGDAGDDSLLGQSGNDTLLGGVGADEMDGGSGDDVFSVDDAGDLVLEAANDGADLARSTISLSLGQNLENLILLGSGAINGTGNELNNRISGNSAANAISGLAGADTLVGGDGNDVYFVDSAGDRVVEAANHGNDWVKTLVSYTLSANVERLTLMAGAGSIDGAGNGGNDRIIGNASSNIISGKAGDDTTVGGTGNDTLTGGAGKDSFSFTTALNAATNVDAVTDFTPVDDTCRLAANVFTGLAAGVLSAQAFNTGSAASETDDRIVYNPLTGELIFDSNGSNTGGVKLFARLDAGLSLSHLDFIVV